MPEEIYPMDEDWDYLLVLDACRYDYFEELYDDYFKGDLKRVKSPGSETSEWCRNSFTEKYEDVVYVSGNPRINSKMKVKGFGAKEHFHEVVDVWNFGWNSEKGTVLPSTINEAVLDVTEEFPDKRIIAHYMQPHAPYLGFGSLDTSGVSTPDVNYSEKPKHRKFLSRLTRLVGQRKVWKIRSRLGLSPNSPMYRVFEEVGEEGLRDLYEDNLRRVLKGVSYLCEKIKGNIVVSTDHGELLGEGGNYGHYRGMKCQELREIFWFQLSSVVEHAPKPEKSRVKSRIRELKDSKRV